MPITKAQGEILKALVDEDANLVGANLQLKDVPDYYDFMRKWDIENPAPADDADWEVWDAHNDTRNAAWGEAVNKALLPENITGACVIGGFAIAALKSGAPITLRELAGRGNESNLRELGTAFETGIGSLGYDIKNELMNFTGMSFDELYTCQRINDSTKVDNAYYSEYGENGSWAGDIDNPIYGKTPEEATIHRRERLKEFIDSISILE